MTGQSRAFGGEQTPKGVTAVFSVTLSVPGVAWTIPLIDPSALDKIVVDPLWSPFW